MTEPRSTVSIHESIDITERTTGALPSHLPEQEHPVTPAAGCITALIDFSRLNELRKRTGKSYQTIADALDMSKATVSRFFTGQSPNPSLYNTIRIFGFLELSIDEVAGLEKPTPPAPTDQDLQSHIRHLEYVCEIKDQHIDELEQQLSAAVEMREKYKVHFLTESRRERQHYEEEIEKIRSRAERQFRQMFTMAFVLLGTLIAYTITDLCLPDRGLFQFAGLV